MVTETLEDDYDIVVEGAQNETQIGDFATAEKMGTQDNKL